MCFSWCCWRLCACSIFFFQTDVVHDALLSALGGRMSASTNDVQLYVSLRRAPYSTDWVVMANAPDCARTVKRLLYCSDRFRVVRKPGGSLPGGPMSTYEFQLARSGGSVPRTLSMQRLAHGHSRTPSPVNTHSASRRTPPTEHWRKRESAVPAIPAPQLSGPETATVYVPSTTDAAHLPHLGEGQEMSPPWARTGSDGAISKVTAEIPEDNKAPDQSTLEGACCTRVRTATTGTRGDASPTEALNVSPLDGHQADLGLAESLVGAGPLDFSADFHALLPEHVQGLPLVNEAEETLSEELLNFREWDTNFGWSCP